MLTLMASVSVHLAEPVLQKVDTFFQAEPQGSDASFNITNCADTTGTARTPVTLGDEQFSHDDTNLPPDSHLIEGACGVSDSDAHNVCSFS
jgi:hypothetical protein